MMSGQVDLDALKQFMDRVKEYRSTL
jgi:hypothetical protein